jgi:hypothetical protein
VNNLTYQLKTRIQNQKSPEKDFVTVPICFNSRLASAEDKALEQFMSNVPEKSGMAFVIQQLITSVCW